MCGIAGYIGRLDLDPKSLKRCLELMQRRGPDASAYRVWKTKADLNVYLLHSRLSIIDANPRSNQPLEVNRKWIVCNGELYNYHELHKALQADGIEFFTESDTEVLLQIISREGWSALKHCEGMWAFAVYDQVGETLSLCRDRFGEKPLYLYRDTTGLYFGSEVKCIVALLNQCLEIDVNQLFRFLGHGYKALYKGEHSFFKGLSELSPASVLHLDLAGKEQRVTYWLPCYAPEARLSYPEAVAGVRERLIRTVDLRLRADTPAAFCLSGGVDSNSLVSIAKVIFGYEVHGFTIVSSDPRYDEREVVDRVVGDLAIRHTSVQATTTSFLPILREMVRYHEAPVYTITAYAHWLLMRSVADHGYRIAISGVGADELFSGYYDHHLAYLAEIHEDQALHAHSRQAWGKHIQPFVKNPLLRDPDLYVNNPRFREHIFLDGENFRDYLKEAWSEPFTEQAFTGSLLRNRMLNEMFEEIVPVILHQDDLNAMYYSIENRSPYLDRNLFEFCYRIPSGYLMRDGLAKAVLRDAMRGIVPDHVLENRKKVGFNASLYTFLDKSDPELEGYLFAESPIYEFVRRDKIRELFGKEWLPNSESKFLFSFLSSKLFLEEFVT